MDLNKVEEASDPQKRCDHNIRFKYPASNRAVGATKRLVLEKKDQDIVGQLSYLAKYPSPIPQSRF
jgi:hypothetical protein